MTHIKRSEEFIAHEKLNEGIIGNFLKTVSAGVGAVIKGFTSPLTTAIQNIKTSWNQSITADKIKSDLKAAYTEAFNNGLKALGSVKNEADITALFDDVTKAMDMFNTQLLAAVAAAVNESLNESVEQLDLYGSLHESKADEVKNAVSTLFGAVKQSMVDAKKNFTDAVAAQKDLNNKIATAKTQLTTIFKTALARLDATDIKSMIKSGGIKPGQTVTYQKKDGTEGQALIKVDQSDASPNHYVMMSLTTNTQFQVPMNKILKVIKDVEGTAATTTAATTTPDKDNLTKSISTATPEQLTKIQQILNGGKVVKMNQPATATATK